MIAILGILVGIVVCWTIWRNFDAPIAACVLGFCTGAAVIAYAHLL